MRFLHSLFLPKAFPEGEGTGLKGDEDDCQRDRQEEANHIQRVVLVPGEAMDVCPNMFGSFVVHANSFQKTIQSRDFKG